MYEEQLDEAGMVFNLMIVKPEYGQHFRLCGRGEDQVSGSQHGQKSTWAHARWGQFGLHEGE